MSPAEIARSLHARRIGKGKWVARCPAHKERTASLYITPGKDDPNSVWLHCFAGCSQADVLKAAGLTWRDLRPGKVTPEIRQRMTLEDQRKALERQLGLVIVLGAIEKVKRAYWNAAERRIRSELYEIRVRLEPEKVWQEYRERQIQKRIEQHGFENLWEETYGVDGAGKGTQTTKREIRPDSVYGGSRELP